MKKLLFSLPIVFMLASGCNSSSTSFPANQTQPNQQTQVAPEQAQIPPNQQQSKQTSPSSPSINKYLAIKEWGVEFKKPTGMQDLQYVVFAKNGSSIAFTTQQLMNLDKSASNGQSYCTADQTPIGVLARTNNLSSFGGHYVPTNIKIGNYYYWFEGPQATCSDNKQVQQLETQQANALATSILKTLQLTTAK